MALIPIKITRTSKPPVGTPIRSDGHWSVQGLSSAWAINEFAGTAITSSNNTVAPLVNTSWSGDGLLCQTNTKIDTGLNLVGDTAITVIAGCIFTGLAGSLRIFGNYASSVYSILLAVSAGAPYKMRSLITTTGGSSSLTGNTVLVNGKPYVFGLTYDGAQLGLYVDGYEDATPLAKTGAMANTANTLYLFSDSAGTVSHSGVGQWSYRYSRALSPPEIASLSANPWQIYEPEIVWVESGGDTPTEQTITFEALAEKTYGDAPFALTATASSGLPVSYASSNTSVATVDGSTVTIVGVGSTNITATQAGDGTWAAATPVVQSLTVAKADQTISISAPSYKLPTDDPFAVSATASSGLTCTLSILSGPATILNGTVTLTGDLGDVVIRAVQAGNDNYNAAANTDRTVHVVEELPVFDAGGLTLSLQLTI